MQQVVTVLPDIRGIDSEFDYIVPREITDIVEVGLEVVVPFRNRRVRGWITGVRSDRGDLAESVELKSIIRARSKGPPPDVVGLARWAAWRWAGKWSGILATASSPRIVDPHKVRMAARDLRATQIADRPGLDNPGLDNPGPDNPGPVIIQLAPAVDSTLFVAGEIRKRLRLANRNNAYRQSGVNPGVLVLCPTHSEARHTADRLAREGFPVALLPDDWNMAWHGGCVAVGTRQAVFAPLPALLGIFILSAHDSLYKEERTPSWSAWQVAAERSLRAGVPCWLVTPWPTLAMLEEWPLITPPVDYKRGGWPAATVVDIAGEDPYEALLSDELKYAIRWVLSSSDRIGLVVLNRLSKVKVTICNSCRKIPRCTRCNHALDYSLRALHDMSEADSSPNHADTTTADGTGAGNAFLSCARCGSTFEAQCTHCGSQRLCQQETRITRIRQRLEKYFGVPVEEVSRNTAPSGHAVGTGQRVQLYLGTEALLYRHTRASLVIFLDIDPDLLAPRLDAAENTIAMLVRAAWITRDFGHASRGSETAAGNTHGGNPPSAPASTSAPASETAGAAAALGRNDATGSHGSPSRYNGGLIVQTRVRDHPVIRAVLAGDPNVFTSEESGIRRMLALPPYSAVVRLSGAGAETYAQMLEHAVRTDAAGADVGVVELPDGSWVVSTENHKALCDLLASTKRPAQRVRVEVDPPSL
ncbi:MAG: primosomal protein N' family DNA-binding protein [Acidimicrobiales bacterium]